MSPSVDNGLEKHMVVELLLSAPASLPSVFEHGGTRFTSYLGNPPGQHRYPIRCTEKFKKEAIRHASNNIIFVVAAMTASI